MSETNTNKLSVVLEGDPKKLQAALKAANKAMDNFDKKAKKTGAKNSGMGGILATAKKDDSCNECCLCWSTVSPIW